MPDTDRTPTLDDLYASILAMGECPVGWTADSGGFVDSTGDRRAIVGSSVTRTREAHTPNRTRTFDTPSEALADMDSRRHALRQFALYDHEGGGIKSVGVQFPGGACVVRRKMGLEIHRDVDDLRRYLPETVQIVWLCENP